MLVQGNGMVARRETTEGLRIKQAVRLIELEKKRAYERMLAGQRDGCRGRSRDIVARKLGISGRHLDTARKVVRAAEDGSAPIAMLYLDGTVSASLAYEALVGLGKQEQARLVKAVAKQPPDERPRFARTLLRERLARIKWA